MKDRSESFIATREHHQNELAEDYVELIKDLIDAKEEARVKDIASSLGVSHVTVIKTIERLKEKGLIEHDESLKIRLTEPGQELAVYCKERHTLMIDFFIKLGVPLDVAEVDVEGMEHHVSKETLECIKKFLT